MKRNETLEWHSPAMIYQIPIGSDAFSSRHQSQGSDFLQLLQLPRPQRTTLNGLWKWFGKYPPLSVAAQRRMDNAKTDK